MSPPLMCVQGGGGQSNDSLSPSLPFEYPCLKEQNYFGFSDCSSVDSSTSTSLCLSDHDKHKLNLNLNLKATELRLGLPGAQSPHTNRDFELCLLTSSKLDEKPLTPLNDCISSSQKSVVAGSKRRFSDTVEQTNAEANWMFKSSSSRHDSDASKHVTQCKLSMNVVLSSSRPSGPQAPPKTLQDPSRPNNNSNATKGAGCWLATNPFIQEEYFGHHFEEQ